ncbi:MAG: chromosomal replication initiator DnaA [Sphingomonadales bacterium]|nr:chromosomal replication initiator DnaA [Sphingomonadales bacterium]
MSQLPLPMAWSRRGGVDSLLIHDANRAAIAFLRDPAIWPSHCSLLVGAPKSGRTLIGELLAAESGMTIIDDADREDEERLFNRWNQTRDEERPLLLIAREPPPAWPIALPDLRTRLATAAVARIDPPDEAISAALIAHGLEQAGSAFAPDVPEFLARRTARCYEDIEAAVARLNALSLSAGGKLSIASARQVLCNNSGLDETADH